MGRTFIISAIYPQILLQTRNCLPRFLRRFTVGETKQQRVSVQEAESTATIASAYCAALRPVTAVALNAHLPDEGDGPEFDNLDASAPHALVEITPDLTDLHLDAFLCDPRTGLVGAHGSNVVPGYPV